MPGFSPAYERRSAGLCVDFPWGQPPFLRAKVTCLDIRLLPEKCFRLGRPRRGTCSRTDTRCAIVHRVTCDPREQVILGAGTYHRKSRKRTASPDPLQSA